MAFPMASATVSAISNHGSVKEYTTKFAGYCVREDITPKQFSTYIIIIANIIFELETSTIFVGIR